MMQAHETGAPERAPQSKTRPAGSETGAPTYSLRGRFVARHTFTVPEELTLRDEPAPMPQLPRWYSLAAFLLMSSATIFAMCAMGRPGA